MGGMDGGSDRVAPVLCASPATLPHGWGQVESLRRPLRLHDVICGHTPPLMTSSVVLRSPRHDASLREAGVRPQPHRNGSRQVQHGPCQRALGHRPRRAADATSGQWVLLREASAPRRRSPLRRAAISFLLTWSLRHRPCWPPRTSPSSGWQTGADASLPTLHGRASRSVAVPGPWTNGLPPWPNPLPGSPVVAVRR